MANSPSIKAPSHPQTPLLLPDVRLPEISTGVSPDTRGSNEGELDPQAMLQMAAQWAASITGANGAAIAVGDASGMSCRAGVGNAPMLGTPVSSTSGLSGVCLQTSKLVQCDDTETDSRVDAQACRELDLRSLLIVPVLVDSELKALIEVFSSKPHAFDARHSENLSRMADSLAVLLAKRNAELVAGSGSSTERITSSPQALDTAQAAQSSEAAVLPTSRSASSSKASAVIKPFPATVAGVPKAAPAEKTKEREPKPIQPVAQRRSRWGTLSAARKLGIVGVCLVLLLGVVGFLVGWNHNPSPEAVTPEASASPEKNASAGPEITVEQSGLSIATPVDGSSQGAGQTSQLTPGKLIHRVEPAYPPSARDNGIGGSVVLTAIVGVRGTVESVKFVRGPEPLAEAATEAVRQWVYEPYRRNGEPVAVETTIIVKFTPPKP